jgi:hypothetical protein
LSATASKTLNHIDDGQSLLGIYSRLNRHRIIESNYIKYVQGSLKPGTKSLRIITDKRPEMSDRGLFSYPIEMEDLVAYIVFDPNVCDGRGNKIRSDLNMSWGRGCVGPRCRLHGGRRYAFQADPVMAVTR